MSLQQHNSHSPLKSNAILMFDAKHHLLDFQLNPQAFFKDTIQSNARFINEANVSAGQSPANLKSEYNAITTNLLSDSQSPVQNNWHDFVEMQIILHEVLFKLGKIDNGDEILKQAVILARSELGFDRIGMLLYDEKTDEIVGTWGTDTEGNLSDEHESRNPSKDSGWVERVLQSHDQTSVWEDVELKQWGKNVGKGWNVMAGMWDGERCIGWIACDNLLTLKALEPWRNIILGQFAKNIGSLLIQSRQKQELKYINENLEMLVNQKSAQIRLKVQQLETAKDDLVEAEKLASLGALVAGVAHEINTPVGIGITAASYLKEQVDHQLYNFNNNKMRKSELENFFEQSSTSSEIILKNLNLAGELINSFKKIAADQTHDIIDTVNLHELVDDLLRSFKHVVKKRPINIINDVDPSLSFKSYAGRINQILSNLIKNSLLHGFEINDEGVIKIKATLENDQLFISYFDTGKGVEQDKLNTIFDPFYTTKRGQGGTGLGLSIIHNLIVKMQGSISVKNNVAEQGLRFDFDIKVNGND